VGQSGEARSGQRGSRGVSVILAIGLGILLFLGALALLDAFMGAGGMYG
jgi:hypothetical protein